VFKRHPENISDLLNVVLRNQGLETPLQQRRLVNAWNEVISEKFDTEISQLIIESTESKDIRNQTLWVKILSPAIRQELQMRTSDLVATLNNKAGSYLISNIKFY
jgi:predicted nucleic acid-binding Zn ribbon protein